MNLKKYMTTTVFLIGILLFLLVGLNIFMNSLENIFSILVNGVIIILLIITIFSTLVTYMVVNDKNVNKYIMRLNFNIVSFLYPVLIILGNTLNVPKNEIRKVYIKLNNSYIYSNRYNIEPKDILILIPHCIQKSECKLKITTNVRNCKSCGLCNVKDLIDLQNKYNVDVFIATGGTLARKKKNNFSDISSANMLRKEDKVKIIYSIESQLIPIMSGFNIFLNCSFLGKRYSKRK